MRSIPTSFRTAPPRGLWRIGWAFLALVLALPWAAPAGAGVESVAGGVRFSYTDSYAGQVSLAGDFNDWNATSAPMIRSGDGTWSVIVPLTAGEHQYKFVVDGQWVADPENPVTGGDFGNSLVKIGGDGKVVVLKATSNTELSPKVFLGSRYIVLMQDRKIPGSNPEWNLDRPNFDIDFDFNIRVNEDLTAHVLTNINNQNQNVQLWESNLRFDRGSLLLQNEDINLIAFDNDSVGVWEDPLHLVGDVGLYHHSWGYNQQGVMAWRQFGKFEGRLLYSDDFRTGGVDSPQDVPLQTLKSDVVAFPGGSAFGTSRYNVNTSDNNKNVLATRWTRPIGESLTAGVSYRIDRGRNPGALVQVADDQSLSADSRRVSVRYFPRTVESWHGGGLDLRYRNDPSGVELFGEVLGGESWIATGKGEYRQITYSGIDSVNGTGADTTQTLRGESSRTLRLNTSRRFTAGVHYFAYRGWHWTGAMEFQDADLVNRTYAPETRYNAVSTYRTGVKFDGAEWKLWPWEAELKLDYYDFRYDRRATWTDQFWFDSNNFWLEQGEHVVTVDRLVMLGGEDVVSWKPHAKWTFYRPRNVSVEYWAILNSTGLSRKPKYWDNQIAFHLDLTRRLGLNTDTRIVRYDDPVLRLKDTFASHFVELKYRFTPAMEMGLSWGVDPWVIDGVANEYKHIGRDLFIFERGADGNAAKNQYLNMTETVRGAEQELEDEKRFQLEAIIKF
jgi:hypothetical protein